MFRSFALACAGALLLASVAQSGARAENSSEVKAAGFKTAFSMCSNGADGNTCSQETWTIKVLPDGWELQAVSTIDGSTLQWSEKCQNGQYDFQGEGIDWTGTCKLYGAPKSLCFRTNIVTTPESDVKMASFNEQCITVTSPTACTMRMTAHNTVTNSDGSVDESLSSGENVTECTASEGP